MSEQCQKDDNYKRFGRDRDVDVIYMVYFSQTNMMILAYPLTRNIIAFGVTHIGELGILFLEGEV